MHGAYCGACAGADQHAVPGGARVVAARAAEARQDASVDRPGQLAAGGVEGAAEAGAAGHQRGAVVRAGLGLRAAAAAGHLAFAAGALAFGGQGALARFLGFAGLAGEGFLDGLEDLVEVFLALLAILELAAAVLQVAVELGQGFLARLAGVGQFLAAGFEGGLLGDLLDYAKARGLKRVWGDVARENGRMLQVAGALGFRREAAPDLSRLRVVKDLA